MGAHGVGGPPLREFLAAAIRLAGVVIDDESLAHSVPLVEALLADRPLLTRAAPPRLEPMSSPGRPVAGS